MLVSALVLQAIVLSLGWFATFRVVQRSFGGVVEDIVHQQNREIAQRVASLLPEVMGDVEFGSPHWERLQQIIEGEALRDLPSGGFVCLVEPDGRLLCHPDIRDDPGLRNYSFDGMRLEAGLNDRDTSVPLLEAGEMGMPGTGIVSFPSEVHFVGTQPVRDDGLRVLVHQPLGDVVRVEQASTRWILAFAGMAAVGVLGISGVGLNALLRRYEGAQERLNRQMHESLLIAQRIQRATLPAQLPEVDGYAFAGASLPAEETGGDTFDINHDEDAGYVSMMVADATGHGIGPALAIAQLQAMARLAARHERDPARIATELNAHMHRTLPDGRFITAWLGVLDPSKASVHMLSAGQDPQLLYRAATGCVERLATDTLPLGVFLDGVQASTRTLDLEPGDMLLVATDGFAEAVSPSNEQFGVDRMIDLVRRQATKDPAAVLDALVEAVEAFTKHAPAGDDRTVVLVQRLPLPPA